MQPLVATTLRLGLALALTACSKPASQTQQQSSSNPSAAATPQAAGPDIDARSLLTKDELAAVQGGTFTGAQGGTDAAGEFRVSQCVFTAEEPNKSVSLVLMTTKPGEGKSRTVQQFWHETFDRIAKGEVEKDIKPVEKTRRRDDSGTDSSSTKNETEIVREKPLPQRLSGLGDDAYWASSHISGTLYVLKGESMVRLSVGGPGTDSERMEKARRLAEKAVARL